MTRQEPRASSSWLTASAVGTTCRSPTHLGEGGIGRDEGIRAGRPRRFGEITVVEPDLLVARRSQFTARDLPAAPLLAVEVLSPSTRHIDLSLKRSRYEAAGCPSYWVVDRVGPTVWVWEIEDGRYVERSRVTGETEVRTERPFPVSFRPVDLVDPES